MATEFITVARLADLPLGTGKEVLANGRKLALFRTEQGIFALAAECPHRAGPLAHGWVENAKVFCPLHGWEFDLQTGACGTNPERPVQCFETRVVGAEIQVATD